MKELQNGKYQLVSLEHEQGFASIWNAIDNDHGITIYTVNTRLENDQNYQAFVETLEREAKAIAQIRHSNFPEMTFFMEDGIPYLVIETIVGKSLQEQVQSNQAIPELEAIPYFREIADGLGELHQQKVSHQNIHPKNIILSGDHAILIGFTPAQQIKPNFTTSEQYNAYVPPFDIRRGAEDIYALAATLYYAVTAKSPESFVNRLTAEMDTLIPPLTHNPTLSRKLNQAILQAMALKAKSRSLIRNWLDVLPKTLDSQTPTEQAYLSPEDKQKAIAKRQIPIAWMLWSGTAYILLGVLLSVALTTKLIGITWLAAIVIAMISPFILAKDHSVSNWATWMSTVLFVAIAVILSSFTSSNIVIILIASMIAIALYLNWRGEWYRVQDLQRAWRKARDRTKDQILGFTPWKSYVILIFTNLVCLLLGRIFWALAHSQGLQS